MGFESNAHDLLPPKQRINFSVMTGIDFENFIVKLFQNKGYTVSTTKISGDNGVDVIAEKEGIRIGIQAKCYSSSVGNSAVQEVVAGLAYYGCNRGMVITSNYFTKAARDLAAANNIILWDKDRLDEEISLCF